MNRRRNTSAAWPRPPHVPPLAEHEVHVWRAEVRDDVADAAWPCLCPDEAARAARFRRDEDRRRFLLGRLLVRTVLGAYLERPPDRIRLRAGRTEKPVLEPDGAGADIRFNLSHAGAWVLVAAARACEVGVDVECWRDDIEHHDLAARFFAPAESAALRALPEAARTRAFFETWTRKEAFVKALGSGLSAPLDQFVISLVPGASSALVRVGWDPAERDRWTVRDLPAEPGYSAALAVAARDRVLRCFEWTPQCAARIEGASAVDVTPSRAHPVTPGRDPRPCP